MSDFNAALDAALPRPTAGSLPATRTFSMVTQAIESQSIEELTHELEHTRAHYQSLEYMLNNEDAIVATILESFKEAEELPTPTTVEEAVRYTARVFATEVLMAAYDSAHHIGLPMALMGLNVQEALQMIYGDLDFSDPERGVVSDDQLAAFIAGAPDED
ncbi:hypothetical protein QDW19_gp56 [Microbacterium phage AvGardian]|uniref:hypothetical protein n=1 Tax=Microbacterium phage AvGardian TaxID=2725619 RepID=UPI001463099E|nr:hypothetical protein QDW19_gp56 [Microbacterium phage AvGardian]QJD49871.1 hypothetical protein SEA_AVGARDIAN_56 [Microbacterium phage AvGardian]